MLRASKLFAPARASLLTRSYCSDTVNLIYVNPGLFGGGGRKGEGWFGKNERREERLIG